METAAAVQVRQLVEPLLTDLGFELVELQIRNEPIGLVLRLIIYKQGGVSLDDCATASRAVGHFLEVEDPIAKAYHLEVSSPGLDRPLTTARDFMRNLGQKVTIKLRLGEETRHVTGLITGIDETKGVVTVDGVPEEIALADIVRARLVIEF